MTNIKLSISQPQFWLQKICSVARTGSVPQNLFQLVIWKLLDFLSGAIEPLRAKWNQSLETLISLITYSMAPSMSLSTPSTVWSGAIGSGKIIQFLSHGQTWKVGGNMIHRNKKSKCHNFPSKTNSVFDQLFFFKYIKIPWLTYWDKWMLRVLIWGLCDVSEVIKTYS